MHDMILRFLMVAALCMLPTTMFAQSDDPAWLDEVREQAAIAEGCEVNYFLNINETELGGRKVQEARIQCTDGRMFDATRQEPVDTFEFKACEIQVC